MLNPTAYALGANRSCIRELFEYGCRRAAVVGAENVYDYSLGNPSIPAPGQVDDAIRQAFDPSARDNTVFLPKIMSRKKQVIPMLSELWG